MPHHRPVRLVALSLIVLGLTACASSSPRDGVSAGGPLAGPTTGAGGAVDESPSSAPTDNARARRGPSPSEYTVSMALKTVYFEYDRTEVRTQDLPVLDRNAGWMLEHPRYRILIEGHADERGTVEYNTALADKRARTTMYYLVSKGVRADRLGVLSYGEERPVCGDPKPACWEKNRRAVFLIKAE